nr:xylulose kinase-1 [Tanacetum cinerariifolium]
MNLSLTSSLLGVLTPTRGFQDTFDIDKAGKEANLQYVLFPVWSTGSSNSQNKEGNTAFDEKEHDAEKAESAVNLSLSRFFEDFSKDSSNDVSAASPIVPTTGTNPISAAGPLNSNSSQTHRQSSLRDTYQPPDMVEREDIDYSDHENVVAEADFNNLETSITAVKIYLEWDSTSGIRASEATNAQQQPNIQPQIISTVSNNNAKFSYLKKDEYERESKARTTLLQSIPDDHVADFHNMDDARDIWNAVKARLNAESKKMRKSMCNDPLRKEDRYIIIMASHQSIFKKA